MKKGQRNDSRLPAAKDASVMNDRVDQTSNTSTHNPSMIQSSLDHEIETILDPSWAWRMLHKP
jgi:hypothetical protein